MEDDDDDEMQIRWLPAPMDIGQFIETRARYARLGLVFWDEKGVQHVIGSVNWLGGDTARRLYKYRVVAFIEMLPMLKDLNDDFRQNIGRYP